MACRPSGNGIVQKDSTYDWNYTYGSAKPHAPSHIGGRRYAYDTNGERVLKDRAKGRRATINRYYSVRNGAIATKPVFAGNNRLASVVAPGGPEAITTATGDDSFLGGLFGGGDNPGNDRAKKRGQILT